MTETIWKKDERLKMRIKKDKESDGEIFDRMCNFEGCDGCPLSASYYKCNERYILDHTDEVREILHKWEAEHPKEDV